MPQMTWLLKLEEGSLCSDDAPSEDDLECDKDCRTIACTGRAKAAPVKHTLGGKQHPVFKAIH